MGLVSARGAAAQETLSFGPGGGSGSSAPGSGGGDAMKLPTPETGGAGGAESATGAQPSSSSSGSPGTPSVVSFGGSGSASRQNAAPGEGYQVGGHSYNLHNGYLVPSGSNAPARAGTGSDNSEVVCPQDGGVGPAPTEEQAEAAALVSRQLLMMCDLRFGTNLLAVLDKFFNGHPERLPSEFMACSDVGSALGVPCTRDIPEGFHLALRSGGYCFDGTKFVKLGESEDCAQAVARAKASGGKAAMQEAALARPAGRQFPASRASGALSYADGAVFCSRDQDCGSGACFFERNLFTNVVLGRCYAAGASSESAREAGRSCLLDSDCESKWCESGICRAPAPASALACATPGDHCTNELSGTRGGEQLEKILAGLHTAKVDRHTACCPGAVCAQQECVYAPSALLASYRLGRNTSANQSCRSDVDCDIEHGLLCLSGHCQQSSSEALDRAAVAGPEVVSFGGGSPAAPAAPAAAEVPEELSFAGKPQPARAPAAPVPAALAPASTPAAPVPAALAPASAPAAPAPAAAAPAPIAAAPAPVAAPALAPTPEARRPATAIPAPPPPPPVGPSKIECQAGYAVVIDSADMVTMEDAERSVAHVREAGWMGAEAHEAMLVGCEYHYADGEMRRVYRVGPLNAAEILRRYQKLGAHAAELDLRRELKERGLVAR